MLKEADDVILLPVYAASEEIIEAGTTEVVYEELLGLKDVSRILNLQFSQNLVFSSIQEIVESYNGQAVTVLLIGAGDIEQIAVSYPGMYLTYNEAWQSARSELRHDTKFTTFEALYNKTTLRVGRCAWFYAEPTSAEDLSFLLKYTKRMGCAVYIIVRGSQLDY